MRTDGAPRLPVGRPQDSCHSIQRRHAARGGRRSRNSVSRPTRESVAPPAAASVALSSLPETAAEATPASHHKTWKELAQKHNEERARQPQTSGPSTPSSSASKSATSGAVTAVGALVVVIGLILVLARLFRRHAPLFSQSLPTEALEVLGRRYLDQRQSILLLRVGSRILVVGSSPAGLQGIGELSDPVEVDLVAGMCRPTRNGQGLGSSFFNLIKGQAAPPADARQELARPRTIPARRSCGTTPSDVPAPTARTGWAPRPRPGAAPMPPGRVMRRGRPTPATVDARSLSRLSDEP